MNSTYNTRDNDNSLDCNKYNEEDYDPSSETPPSISATVISRQLVHQKMRH